MAVQIKKSKIVDRAIEQLKNHSADNGDQPFFSYVAFTAPHFPLHALPKDIARVGDRYSPGWNRCKGRAPELK